MMVSVWKAAGLAALALGVIGLALPLVPTVPFLILAAFCFARSNPAWEARLVTHPVYGPHITAWRQRGAISRIGKLGATAAFAGSILMGLWLLAWPWSLLPLAVAAICLTWIWTRPDP
jgi:uncharacterized protein